MSEIAWTPQDEYNWQHQEWLERQIAADTQEVSEMKPTEIPSPWATRPAKVTRTGNDLSGNKVLKAMLTDRRSVLLTDPDDPDSDMIELPFEQIRQIRWLR